MIEITTEIEIAASPAAIWRVLTDFPSYRDWNPFIRSIEGVPETGRKLSVSIFPPGGKAMTFKPVVLTVSPNEELCWRGRFLVPGIFDGEHYFRLSATGEGKTRFIHGEHFSGLLVPIFRSSLLTATKAGFELMNSALKVRAEGMSGTGEPHV